MKTKTTHGPLKILDAAFKAVPVAAKLWDVGHSAI